MRWRLYLRRTIGVIVGIVVSILASGVGWHAALAWFPPVAAGFMSDAPSVVAMPLLGLLTVASGMFAAGLAGAFAGLRIAQWRPAGWASVSVIVVIGYWNAEQVAEPDWLAYASILAPLLGAWLAERHFHRARPGDPLIG